MSATQITSRAAINRANSRHSTGPRTDSGKQRSSLNALRHGLTAASAILPSEDQAAYDAHRRGFFDEYQPATPTETQLTQELADTSWRLNRIPLLEAALLSAPPTHPPSKLASTSISSTPTAPRQPRPPLQRLSRQFQKALATAPRNPSRPRRARAPRPQRRRRHPRTPQTKGIPWDPSDHGFVFSKDQVGAFSQRMMRLNESRHIEHVLFHLPPPTCHRPPATSHSLA